MDKYLLIILMFMIAGMIIALTRDPFEFILFYASLGGAIIIIIYSSMKNRREHNEKRRENRRSKK
jgi:4-hydroxybenzoate polyprenyltransferase